MSYEQNKSNLKTFRLKECSNCFTTETPLWRKSQKGQNLCNACGLYYRNHGENRPVYKLKIDHRKSNKSTDSLEIKELAAIEVLTSLKNRAQREKQSIKKEDSVKNYNTERAIIEKTYLLEDVERKKKRFFSANDNQSKNYYGKNQRLILQSYIQKAEHEDINLNSKIDTNTSSLYRKNIISNDICQVGCSSNTSNNLSKEHPVNDFRLIMKKGRPTIKEYKQMEEYASEEMQDVVNKLVSLHK